MRNAKQENMKKRLTLLKQEDLAKILGGNVTGSDGTPNEPPPNH